MLFEDSWGWVRIRTTQEKLKCKIISEYLETEYLESAHVESPLDVQRIWTPLKQCIPRGKSFKVYFERQYGAKKQKIDLTLNPDQTDNMGQFSIIEPGLNRNGKVVDLKEKKFPGFIRYFEFTTVSMFKSSGENLSWQMGIVKLPEVLADLVDDS